MSSKFFFGRGLNQFLTLLVPVNTKITVLSQGILYSKVREIFYCVISGNSVSDLKAYNITVEN